MAITWQAKTNQQLYQARLAIELLIELKQADQSPSALLVANYQSALFQLKLSYQNYLHELADMAHASHDFTDLKQLSGHGDSQANGSPLIGELKELLLLEADSFSWLSWLLNEYRVCFQLLFSDEHAGLSSGKAVDSKLANNLIAATPRKDLAEQLQQVYTELKGIIDQQRVNQVES